MIDKFSRKNNHNPQNQDMINLLIPFDNFMTKAAVVSRIIIPVMIMKKEIIMKTRSSKSTYSTIRLITALLFLIVFTTINITGCALSRQFIGVNGSSGYGPGYTSSTHFNEWDFLENMNSKNDWAYKTNASSCKTAEDVVEILVGDVPNTGIDLNNIHIKADPAPMWPRGGIFRTGTGVVIVVDLYE